MCYIANVRFHDSVMQQRTEMMNEMLLVFICYHFVLFADDVWDVEFREQVGLSAIVFIFILLGINAAVIVYLNIRLLTCKVMAKCAIRNAKNEAEKSKKARIEQMQRVKDEAEAQKKAELE